MRFKFASVFAAALSLGAVQIASAADMPVKAPVLVPAFSWSGFYIGGSIGARWTDPDWTTTCINGVTACPTNGLSLTRIQTNNPASFDSTSLKGGIYAGYNWQVSPRWVLGIEGDWAWANSSKTIVGIPGTLFPAILATTNDRAEVRETWDASIRGRVGYLFNPNLMVFGTGGASWIHIKASAFCGVAGGWCILAQDFGTTDSQSKTKVGWTVGGGLEWMLTRNWLIRGEYRYADYGTFSATFFNVGLLSDRVDADIKMKTHTAQLGIAYKFNPAGP